jgi:NAD(P)H-hydrate epimerase
LARPDHLAGVPAWQYQIFRSTDGRAVDASALGGESADFILDALIGYGLEAAPRGVYAELIEWANETAAPILSLDVPSGIDSTTGTAPGEFAHAHATMTLALPKTGLVPEKTGRLVLADLGIPVDTYRRLGLDYDQPFDHRYLVPLQVHYTEDQ